MILSALFLFLYLDSARSAADELFKAGRYSEAVRSYIELLRKTPTDTNLLEAAGQTFLRLSAPHNAIPFFEHELVADPHSHRAGRSLSEAFMETGRLDEARTLLNRLIAEDPADSESWAKLGMLSYRGGYYQAAIESFDKALQSAPGAAKNAIEVLRAISLVETGASSQAAKVLPVLLARPENATNLDLLLSTVRFLYESGRYDEALAQAEKAVNIDASNASAHLWFARLLQQKGSNAHALSEAETSRDLAPASPAPRSLLVRLYQKSGRPQDASREVAWLREHAP